ncbi:ATP-binding cassette domain-containing protein [uncultured Cohaesibacter sp.]|uniref:ABC transporter ATP-binding protein n=1 Tax=uncultured Cohaesibacter sp. TaxID=1002546 RepID=UPI002930CF7B|nr:ATP-binding cassette domain-containing protein [uncultured Cohaesibacter sp.]
MSRISLRNINKSYDGEQRVLHDVSMEIEDGEFIVIVGPSGCGKSTLLRLIAGLEKCPEGDIFIADKRANDQLPQHRDIAMIFQNYALYPHLTVRENIAFGLELRRVPKKQRNARAEEVAKTLQLDPYLDRKPAALSGGQRQRVAMGRAIARDTSTFLMDEPLSNLDNALRVAMRTEIKALHKQLGATIIYVTHDQTEALSLADRIAVMKDGYLQQFDTPEAIYDKPANRFVASFLGMPPMNFLSAGKLDFWQGDPDIEVGLRPESLTIAHEQTDAPTLPGSIVLSELTGSDVILHCDTAAGRLTLNCARKELPPGRSDIFINLDMENAHYFNAESGMRLEMGQGV